MANGAIQQRKSMEVQRGNNRIPTGSAVGNDPQVPNGVHYSNYKKIYIHGRKKRIYRLSTHNLNIINNKLKKSKLEFVLQNKAAGRVEAKEGVI